MVCALGIGGCDEFFGNLLSGRCSVLPPDEMEMALRRTARLFNQRRHWHKRDATQQAGCQKSATLKFELVFFSFLFFFNPLSSPASSPSSGVHLGGRSVCARRNGKSFVDAQETLN